MTEQEIFDYLKDNLTLDYDRSSYGNSLEISIKLKPPQDEFGNDLPEVSLGSVWIDIPHSNQIGTYY